MGKVKLGSVILTIEGADDITPNRKQYEQFDSYDGSYQIKISTNQIKEVSFKTSTRDNKESLLKSLDGQSVLASSDIFDPFQCVVSSQKYSVEAGERYAIYNITLKEDKSVPI